LSTGSNSGGYDISSSFFYVNVAKESFRNLYQNRIGYLSVLSISSIFFYAIVAKECFRNLYQNRIGYLSVAWDVHEG